MKRILLLYLTALLSVASWATNEDVLCLTVVETNGEEIYFALGEAPIITHGEGTINVKCTTFSIEDLSLDAVEKLYHTLSIPTVDGIGSISTMDGTLADFSNGKAIITGLKEGAQVYVYTAGGQTLGSVTASTDGNVCVDLNTLKSGQVYILRTPTTSFKIVK